MSSSLAELWKNSRDEEILDALEKWDSTNEAAQRVLIAEIKRRNLDVEIPALTAGSTKPAGDGPNLPTGKVAMVLILAFAVIVAVAFLAG